MYIFANARTVMYSGIQGSPDSWKKFGCCWRALQPMGPFLLADFSQFWGVLSRHQKGQETSLSPPGSSHHLTSWDRRSSLAVGLAEKNLDDPFWSGPQPKPPTGLIGRKSHGENPRISGHDGFIGFDMIWSSNSVGFSEQNRRYTAG